VLLGFHGKVAQRAGSRSPALPKAIICLATTSAAVIHIADSFVAAVAKRYRP
jgi:hypothetical protein